MGCALPLGRLICPQLSTGSAAALGPAGGAPGQTADKRPPMGGLPGNRRAGREQARRAPRARRVLISRHSLFCNFRAKCAAAPAARSPGPPQRAKLQRTRTGPSGAEGPAGAAPAAGHRAPPTAPEQSAARRRDRDGAAERRCGGCYRRSQRPGGRASRRRADADAAQAGGGGARRLPSLLQGSSGATAAPRQRRGRGCRCGRGAIPALSIGGIEGRAAALYLLDIGTLLHHLGFSGWDFPCDFVTNLLSFEVCVWIFLG